MDKLTQNAKIVNYIKENGSATVRELFIYCNINSPTKRLSELRKLGVITEESCKSASGVPFKRYFLKGEVA